MTKMPTSDIMYQIVRYDLKDDIIKDIKELLIYNEADLQSCVYHHMRNHIRRLKKPKWGIYNKPYFENMNVYPDIILFDDTKPRIAIELKWWNKSWKLSEAERDRKKLKTIRQKYPDVTKAFFLYVYDKEEDDKEIEFYSGLKWEKRYYFDVPINIRRIMRKREYEFWARGWDNYKFTYEE